MVSGETSLIDITIVIPTLNRQVLLKRALESALRQTSPCKVLVSDNGSTDGTREYLSTLEHPLLAKRRIGRTVSHQQHAALLQDWVDTEWAVFLSDDDWLEPGFIEAIAHAREDHPSARMIYSPAWIWMWDQKYMGARGPELESGDQFLLQFLRGHREPCWCAMALRMADIRAIGRQPADRAIGDMYYWIRVAGQGEVACVNKPLSNYCYIRDMPDNATSGTPLGDWIWESKLLAREMEVRILSADSDEQPPSRQVNAAVKNFLARTGANQVLWNRLRGRPIPRMWRDVLSEWRQFLSPPKVWPRVLIGLTMPRWAIKTCVLLFVRLRARAEIKNSANS